jgi:hypothetical protein
MSVKRNVTVPVGSRRPMRQKDRGNTPVRGEIASGPRGHAFGEAPCREDRAASIIAERVLDYMNEVLGRPFGIEPISYVKHVVETSGDPCPVVLRTNNAS